jgi:Zn finger protein HypA/HybF involved in hydrogenase expression
MVESLSFWERAQRINYTKGDLMWCRDCDWLGSGDQRAAYAGYKGNEYCCPDCGDGDFVALDEDEILWEHFGDDE